MLFSLEGQAIADELGRSEDEAHPGDDGSSDSDEDGKKRTKGRSRRKRPKTHVVKFSATSCHRMHLFKLHLLSRAELRPPGCDSAFKRAAIRVGETPRVILLKPVE